MKRARSIMVLAALVAIPLFCGFAADKALKVGDKIVDFKLKDVDGREVKTADFRKGKPVILKFGATSCGWCSRQVPHLNKVEAEYKGKVAVLDINIREKPAAVKQSNRRLGVRFRTVIDPTGAVAARYGVRGIPVVIVADKDGKIVYRGHYTPFDRLKKIIGPLLETAKKS